VFIRAPAGIDIFAAGKLRALGVSSVNRFVTLPDVPSISEVVPGYETITSYEPGGRGLKAGVTVANIKAARQRLVLCRLVIDIMRNLHGAYAPASEPFGTRLETFFIGLCVALGQLDGRPFSVTKIAAYMRVPRATVTRRLTRLERWGLIYRRGHYYYLHENALNSLIGLRSYQQIRRILGRTSEELTILDALPD
jgi:biotin operon repressor